MILLTNRIIRTTVIDMKRELITLGVAAKSGLLKGDLIQGVNGRAVSNLTHLLRELNHLDTELLHLKLVRNQELMELTIRASL